VRFRAPLHPGLRILQRTDRKGTKSSFGWVMSTEEGQGLLHAGAQPSDTNLHHTEQRMASCLFAAYYTTSINLQT
jgi:hypothetical protein